MANLPEPERAAPAGREVCITRDFDASPEAVFAAWTDPARLAQWFAPRGAALTFLECDARPGGAVRYCITGPDGSECWCAGAYRKVVPPRRLVQSMALTDRHGKRLEAGASGKDPEWPVETLVTVTFEPIPGGTRLMLRQTAPESVARRTGAYAGWMSMLDRLGGLCADDLVAVSTRRAAAHREAR